MFVPAWSSPQGHKVARLLGFVIKVDEEEFSRSQRVQLQLSAPALYSVGPNTVFRRTQPSIVLIYVNVLVFTIRSNRISVWT